MFMLSHSIDHDAPPPSHQHDSFVGNTDKDIIILDLSRLDASKYLCYCHMYKGVVTICLTLLATSISGPQDKKKTKKPKTSGGLLQSIEVAFGDWKPSSRKTSCSRSMCLQAMC